MQSHSVNLKSVQKINFKVIKIFMLVRDDVSCVAGIFRIYFTSWKLIQKHRLSRHHICQAEFFASLIV